MNDLFSDPAKVDRLASNATERSHYYDWNLHLPVLEKVFEKVLSGEYSSKDAHAGPE